MPPLHAMTPPSSPPPAHVSRFQAFAYWLKLGFISFGGPAGQIALMHQDLVERKRWISERRFLHALNFCMLLPGPEAQQLATYIGWLLHRNWGGIIAGTLFVLPSLLILIGLSWLYLSVGQTPWALALLHGIKPAVTAIVLAAAWRIGSRTLKNGLLWGLALASFVGIYYFRLPFPLIVLGAALLGALGGRIAPEAFRIGGGHGQSRQGGAPALIDDHTPPPAHARYTRKGFLKVCLFGLLLWALPLAGLTLAFGWQGALTQMGWFFTKAALMTFGGAYAVLPYVHQAAVEHYHWLTPGQMMDGLALGETTPGPLIMVVAFVGFVAGWTQALFGAGHEFAAGVVAAVVVTGFTFLPSFVFILAGGPLVESSHGNLKFTAPLTAITAAVVGVILNLAVFFAGTVLWPHGLGADLDGLAVVIIPAGLLALIRYRWGVPSILALSGLAGLAAELLAAGRLAPP